MSETREHLELKHLAAETAKKLGWSAQFEVSSGGPVRDRWVADVLLEKGDRRIAIEVQWSNQSYSQYLARQKRYLASGVEVIWLHRNTRLKPSAGVIEGRVSETEGGGYLVHLKGYPGQTVPASAFIEAALDGSLRFGLRDSDPVDLTIMAAETKCWHDSCGRRYPMIPAFLGTVGRSGLSDPEAVGLTVSLYDVGKHHEARLALMGKLSSLGGWDHVKERSSQTMRETYLSCGCPRCDRILGDHFAFPHIYDARPIGTFQAPLSLLIDNATLEDEDRDAWIIW